MAAAARRAVPILCVVLISTVLTGCRAGDDQGAVPARPDAPILVFNGTGTSSGDVAALRGILAREHLGYATVNSRQLNRMSEAQIRGYRLLVVPGGNFIRIGESLSPNATSNIRAAIQNGLNYLGICAGAFFAGNSRYNGLNLTSGARFGFYAAAAHGIRKTAVPITAAGGEILDQYWEDGPELTGWGAVVARYPDGTPAIVEGAFGDGWVMLSGVHPEAPASWRGGMEFRTPAPKDNAYAATLIRAALNREQLPHY